MNTRLTIEVVDITWQSRIAFDESYIVGTSVLGDFHIKVRPEDYLIVQCPDKALVPLNARKHHALEEAKAACQRTYRTVILSAIVLRREDLDSIS